MSESDLVSGISTMMEHVHPLGEFGQKMLHIKMFELWLCLAYQHDGMTPSNCGQKLLLQIKMFDLVSGISTYHIISYLAYQHLGNFAQKMLHIKMFKSWLCLAYQHNGTRLHPLVGDFAQKLLFLINF